MSDEYELMLLAIKNYTKSERTSSSKDTETVNIIRKFINDEKIKASTSHYGNYDTSTPEFNKLIGFQKCIAILDGLVM